MTQRGAPPGAGCRHATTCVLLGIAVKFVSCRACPLRPLPLFIGHSESEVAIIESLRKDQISGLADSSIIHEGETDPPLYTLFSGWAFRFKTLSDGRRQILNFLLPGDFIGVQQKMGDAAAHGVQALTDVVLCVFRRDALWELHRSAPTLGFGVTGSRRTRSRSSTTRCCRWAGAARKNVSPRCWSRCSSALRRCCPMVVRRVCRSR